MPKETITTTDDHRVRVGWDREGSVQVGVDLETSVVGESGLWSSLNRQGCNDLIRVLRRARDQAFGRDE